MYQATPACSCCGNRQYHVWAAGERVTRPPPAHPSPLGTSASAWRNQSSHTLGGGCSIVAALALYRPPLCPSASVLRSQSSCAHPGRRPPHIRGRGAAPVLCVHDLVLHHGTLAPGHERLGVAKLKQPHPGPPPWPPSPSATRPCARTRVGVAKPKQLRAPGQTTPPHLRLQRCSRPLRPRPRPPSRNPRPPLALFLHRPWARAPRLHEANAAAHPGGMTRGPSSSPSPARHCSRARRRLDAKAAGCTRADNRHVASSASSSSMRTPRPPLALPPQLNTVQADFSLT
ncbi:hypothetical protein K438DRAFT_1998855 [Mycena galopus ATCC 62051]|nr:hypothetical protein K438DRAFT_1998855 [Mycena galopus ATCC 62051]